VIGNYNPDWSIVRYDETGKLILQLIRETKGTQDETKLQFPQERRKIDCARKYLKRCTWITSTSPSIRRPGGCPTMFSNHPWGCKRFPLGMGAFNRRTDPVHIGSVRLLAEPAFCLAV